MILYFFMQVIHGSLCAHNILLTEKRECKISDYGIVSIFSGQKIVSCFWSLIVIKLLQFPKGSRNFDVVCSVFTMIDILNHAN